jgi:hypothetical protein
MNGAPGEPHRHHVVTAYDNHRSHKDEDCQLAEREVAQRDRRGSIKVSGGDTGETDREDRLAAKADQHQPGGRAAHEGRNLLPTRPRPE